jgi:uncharacterized protein (TIGR02117 family)
MVLLRRMFIYLLYFLGGLIAFIALWALIAWISGKIPVAAQKTDAPKTVTIWLKTNGMHADIVVPARNAQKDWTADVSPANTLGKSADVQWLGIGWGDKGFYMNTPTWADLTVPVAFRAVTGLGGTAMHCTYYPSLTADSATVPIFITEVQYAHLIDYINTEFDRDATGNVQLIQTDQQYGQTDAFYEANGLYSIFKTSNTWTNTALKAAGQRACLWTLFDDPMFDKYK